MKYDLVFEGGGAKGIAFGGALRAFFDNGNSPGRVMGTSAGAITACLVAAGYGAGDVERLTAEKQPGGRLRFAEFIDTIVPLSKEEVDQSRIFAILRDMIDFNGVWNPLEPGIENTLFHWLEKQPFFPWLFAPLEKGHLYTDDAFQVWLREKLNARQKGLGEAAFAEFAEETGSDLTVIASDITDNRLLILNHRTAPDCPVVQAVRMSMSVPLAWNPISWREEWGNYMDQSITEHAIVDGGIISNFPIELFITERPEVQDCMGQSNNEVLGLLIDETLYVPDAPPPKIDVNEHLAAIGNLNGAKQLRHVLETMMYAYDNRAIQMYDEVIVRLPAKGYGIFEFDMGDERREALLAASEKAMHDHLNQEAFFKSVTVDQIKQHVIDKAAIALLY